MASNQEGHMVQMVKGLLIEVPSLFHISYVTIGSNLSPSACIPLLKNGDNIYLKDFYNVKRKKHVEST